MPTLYTIGYERRSLREFVGLLQRAGIDAVIDIRLRNTSQLAGYTKRDDLAFLLEEGFGIAYEHHPELAPTDAILDDYHRDHDWQHYQSRFIALLGERHAERTGRDILSRYRAPCLLCHEAEADHCHRSLVAQWWAAHIPELIVTHL
ncbi:MAG: DUF488 family protein [Anaerolineae bacterium]